MLELLLRTGMLRLLFHPDTFKLLGIRAIGQRATEIIHIGRAVLAFGGTVEYFRDAVFNYPTLAEAYKPLENRPVKWSPDNNIYTVVGPV